MCRNALTLADLFISKHFNAFFQHKKILRNVLLLITGTTRKLHAKRLHHSVSVSLLCTTTETELAEAELRVNLPSWMAYPAMIPRLFIISIIHNFIIN